MGRGKRVVPKRLPEKLKKLRLDLHLSLERMVGVLEPEIKSLGHREVRLYSGHITEFEQGKREPSLPILLAYARVSRINVELLIDDGMEVQFIK